MPTRNGNSSNDVLIGKSWRDKIFGNDGDDKLYGGKGLDQLYGGKGDDLLVGGLQVDQLYGGAGADTFQFVEPKDSKRWNNEFDHIHDFSRAENDKIDLSVLDADNTKGGNQSFNFSSNSGDGNVWTERQGSDLLIKADIKNGTMVVIKLDNFRGDLTDGDFIL